MDVSLNWFLNKRMRKIGEKRRCDPQTGDSRFPLLKTSYFFSDGGKDKFSLGQAPVLTYATAGSGEEYFLVRIKRNRALAIGVHPDEGAVCVGVHAHAESHRAEIDEFALGQKAALRDHCAYPPAPMPSCPPFSQESALFGNCGRKSFFVTVDDADREQDQREAVIHDQI